MKPYDTPVVPEPMDRMGQNLARVLSLSCTDLPHDLGERLRVARERALAVRKPEPVSSLVLVAQGHSLTLTGPESQQGLGTWGKLGSIIPLLALVAGLVTMQWLDREKIVSELAEVDTALLVDDLPPAAYSDPGFIQFLRQGSSESRGQD